MIRTRDNLFAVSVRRPVFITVVNLLIIIAGVAALMGVDVRELPDVDRPIVGVRAVYQGASPKTMDAEITSLVEGAVARVSGVQNITSSSEENNMRLRAEFSPSMDLNIAASDVREAVNRVQRDLPEDVDQLVVLKADADADPIIQLAATSEVLSQQELVDRLEKDVTPEFLSIEGVAEVRLEGDQRRVLRVMLDPAKMAGYRINISEVIDSLRTARFDVPAGSYKSADQELLVRAYASVIDPRKVERLHVRDDLRIGDFGAVFYARERAESFSLLNGRLIVGMEIVRQAGTNTIAIATEVQERLNKINRNARDFEISVISDDSVYIKGALTEVFRSLLFSIGIVLFLIWIFLGQWRTVMIPAVTMPVSLIGTIAAIWLFGFSINLLTLLALVLATGLIVDDAIVVLENIQRNRAKGTPRLAAAVIGTEQVFFAVVATTVTLVSVFLPIAFLPGEAGRMFQEFGLVLAIAVIISSFVAVTLCPMMSSRLPESIASNPLADFLRRTLDGIGAKLSDFYFASLRGILRVPLFTLLCSVSLAGFGLYSYVNLDKELLPKEDRGSLEIILTGPDGASLSYADRQSQQVEAILAPYQEQGLITDVYTIVGRWDRNRAYSKAKLVHWDERSISQMDLAREIQKELGKIPGCQIRVRQRSSISIRGGGRGLQFAILGTDYEEMFQFTNDLSTILQEQVPEVEDVTIQFDNSQPELAYNINREKARDLGVSMQSISQTLRVMVDEFDIMDLNVDDQAVPLMIGSSKGAINDPGDLLNIFVINNDRELIPLSALIEVEEKGVAAELDRHAQRRAIEMDLGLKANVPMGAVVEKVRNVVNENLPSHMGFIFLGEAQTLDKTSYDVAITFLIALLVVFLVLAAQFESFGSALIVIFTVPFGLAFAIFALILSGQTLNLYSQIGLVMLVGLMTKNAILLIEFMDQLRDEGRSVKEAVIEGVKIRLRPVMMTVLSTVIGSLPLILSSGPGSEARNAIGWVVFGGLGFSTLITLYLAPLGYSLIAPLMAARNERSQKLQEEMDSLRTGM